MPRVLLLDPLFTATLCYTLPRLASLTRASLYLARLNSLLRQENYYRIVLVVTIVGRCAYLRLFNSLGDTLVYLRTCLLVFSLL